MPQSQTPNTAAAQPGTTQPDRPVESLTRAERQALFRRGGSLVLMGIALILCVGVVTIVILRRHRQRILPRGGASKKRRPPTDPWFESGRRIGPRGDGAPPSRITDDDTVDLDPDELDDFDIEGEGGKEGKP